MHCLRMFIIIYLMQITAMKNCLILLLLLILVFPGSTSKAQSHLQAEYHYYPSSFNPYTRDSIFYKYDANGKVSESIMYIHYDSVGALFLYQKKEFESDYFTTSAYDSSSKKFHPLERTFTLSIPAVRLTGSIRAGYDTVQNKFYYTDRRERYSLDSDSTVTNAYYYRDSAKSSWRGSVRYTQGSAKKTFELYETWSNTLWDFVPLYRSRTYTDTGNTSVLLYENYDTVSSGWIIHEKDITSYNPDNTPSQIVSYGWDNSSGSLVLGSRKLFSYTASTNTVITQEDSYDPSNQTFRPRMREVIQYKNNHVIFDMKESYNSGWQINSIAKNDYDSLGHSIYTEYIYYSKGQITYGNRDSSFYDASGHIFLKKFFSLNTIKLTWENLQRETTTYTTMGLIKQFLTEYRADLNAPWTKRETTTYDYDLNDSLVRRRTTGSGRTLNEDRYYYDLKGGIDKADNPMNCTIYPNPFSNDLTFELKTNAVLRGVLLIRDLLGGEVYSTILEVKPGSNTYHWQSPAALPAGIYTYNILIKDKMISGKMVKE